MNGYGVVEQVYRPLGIGVIKPNDGTAPEVIFTTRSMKGGEDGFHEIKQGDVVNYEIFQDDFGGRNLARDVWPRDPGTSQSGTGTRDR
jgi:hypothetical protein